MQRPAAAGQGQAPGDYAALGQLIADVTGSDYPRPNPAGARPARHGQLVVPGRLADEDPDAVTGYELEPDGTFVPDLDDVTAIQLAAGLWTTAADLVRFGTGWSSRCPTCSPARRSGRRPVLRPRLAPPQEPMAAPRGRRRPRRVRVPDRRTQRQTRLRRADEPEGVYPGLQSQGLPAGLELRCAARGGVVEIRSAQHMWQNKRVKGFNTTDVPLELPA